MTFSREIHFPTDDDGFLRRECPFCCKEFKVKFLQDEINDISSRSLDNFLTENNEKDNNELDSFFFCPYCGQRTTFNEWWTKEQVQYINVVASNFASSLINEHLIQPLTRSTRGSRFIKFEGKPLKQDEEWIGPESNDMSIFELKCCDRKIKIIDEWKLDIHCFFCGFPHKISPLSL